MVEISLICVMVGIIGNIMSAFLFLSPAPTFLRIYKNKSTEEFHPYPYLAALMSCMMWIFYGLPIVHPDSILVITINSFGLFLEIIYISMFYYYTSKNKYRKRICLIVVGELVLLAAIVAFSLLQYHTTDDRTKIVGIICIIFGSIMYGSPLSNMARVYKTKETEYIPFWLCLAGFLNGACWFSYAFLETFDLYIAVGNGIGGNLGFVQLCVFGYYHLWRGKKDNVAKDEEGKKGR